MRMHEGHYAGRAIIIFRYLFRTTQFRVIKKLYYFVSFQVSDASCTHVAIYIVYKRSELASLAHSFYI